MYDMPPCSDITTNNVLLEYKHLLRSKSGATTLAYHHIPTTENPVRVPPRQIPDHYKEEVKCQIQEMLQQGIIEENCSPWMALQFLLGIKKSGDIRTCIDYRELNKKPQKDTYPLLLPD